MIEYTGLRIGLPAVSLAEAEAARGELAALNADPRLDACRDYLSDPELGAEFLRVVPASTTIH